MEPSSKLPTISLTWGILSVLVVIVACFPVPESNDSKLPALMLLLIYAANWFHLPFALLGVVISTLTIKNSTGEPKDKSKAGLACCLIVFLFGIARLAHHLGVL